MSPSDPHPPPHPQSGVTLFEILVSLAILAMILSVAASRLSRPDRFSSERVAAEIAEAAAAARLKAIREAPAIARITQQEPCAEIDAEPPVTFFPDGTAAAQPFCLHIDGAPVFFRVDPVTGRLEKTVGTAP